MTIPRVINYISNIAVINWAASYQVLKHAGSLLHTKILLFQWYDCTHYADAYMETYFFTFPLNFLVILYKVICREHKFYFQFKKFLMLNQEKFTVSYAQQNVNRMSKTSFLNAISTSYSLGCQYIPHQLKK